MEEYFVRQRRNLILMSTLVLFVNISGADIEVINLLGNEVSIKNSDSIPKYMFLVLAYLLIRYLQYMHEVKDTGLKRIFYRRAAKYLEGYILRREHKKEDSDLKRCYPNRKDVEVVEPLVMFDDAMPDNTAAVSFCGIQGGPVIDMNEVRIENKELVIPFIVASIYVTARTNIITEYAFPIGISFLAFLSYLEPVKCFLG